MWNPNRELSEDCLYLNVWTPYPRPKTPTPVLVWIYGGGFYSGASSLDVYDGRFLAQAEGTVLVSMNYRVGAFGFLALPGSREAPGNVGLLDQRLALRWVRENVAAFGGDPLSVTLFGESAGAASVGMHLLSPPSRDLFHRAVLQSGAPNGPWATVGMGEARRRATLLAGLVGCPPGGAGSNDTELVACLRTRPAQDLVDHEWHVLPQESVFRFSFVPVVDGDFLSDTPEALINTGDFHGLQVLVGVVKDEGSYFLVYGAPGFSKDNESLISRAQFLAGVRVGVPQVSDLAAEAVVLHYTDWLHPEDPARLREAMSDVVGDHNVVCPVVQLAGRLAAQGARVYAYIFEHRASTLSWPPWMGVPHGYEIEFIFGLPLEPSLNYTIEERAFAQRLMKYWANFARTGDPNDPRDPKAPQWPQYTGVAQQYVSLNLRPLEVRRGLRAQACAFWNGFLPKLLSATDATCNFCPNSGTLLLPTALEPLKDVHLGLAPPGGGPARLAILSGHYLYYHYGCDGLDDRGWGCGYRTLQTLCSWPHGRPVGVPGLMDVQAALEDMGDKPPGFRGSRDWIGCVEASLCLEYFRGPQGRLCHVPRGAGLQGELERLHSHFAGAEGL
ncbi:hypothetical protein QTO34_013646 [Cnephaeus nilssonii]|uniref:Carboxylic ester hydrolase n=1 Tax=Cnephaeus nilssonii TaxID=3371016 RepID=A0AA40LV24_CNENI|nr:hypothetical protein QTO34_013646 [Eptesicus nilssonii]